MMSEHQLDFLFIFLPARRFNILSANINNIYYSDGFGLIVKEHTYKIIYNTKYIVFFY